ncbi:MAG TPA: hypothetical protein VHO69_11920 [Phototrophicaceae bacterium]|nr:hypothetical protein [Phototrophicaceae bacterium]
MTSTTQNMYCSTCDEITEHAKISYADIEALKKLADKKANEDGGVAANLYKKYPNWLKDVVFGSTAVSAGILNAVSNYFLNKDYASVWICSKCKRYQNRMFE